ncbi:hypothetical protein PZE06_08195 [Robertmurraya sp. DFI.2.37]|uniref:hypothetical protein n=1 Tax=Robertmurraya sp. DFI.2.37 TaxID=3031819 RepID=UPI001244330D|nr:hypothetical protein [Robertmurraya sp. DFI.2.37]MDF1508163.1 hypothetical protein [Robertmurraya sp. DFI.2.37]
MYYQVQIWKGLTSPYVSAHQINKAEKLNGIWKWTVRLLLISLILSGISAYLGIGNESLSKLIYDTTSSEFQTIKGLFAIGQVVQSTVTTAILIFLPALIFWIFTDIEYYKLVVVQLFVAGIWLLEKIVFFPLQFYFGLDHASSPFSLGILAQYITDYQLLSHFFGEISLFSIWVMFIQYKYLSVITEKSPRIILLLIVSIQLFFWIFTALFSYIKFEVLF